VVATVSEGPNPLGVAVAPDGSRVYVANWSNSYSVGTVGVIDTATNTVVTHILTAGLNPVGVAVTPDGKSVYVTDYTNNAVSVIDTASNSVADLVPVGSEPEGVAVTPDGKSVYVVNTGDNTVSVINPSTNLVVATVPVGLVSQSAAVGLHPQGLAVTHDGKSVYVANTNANTMSVIATATNTVVATVPAGNGPVAFGNFIGP